jgi:hypothetical protein
MNSYPRFGHSGRDIAIARLLSLKCAALFRSYWLRTGEGFLVTIGVNKSALTAQIRYASQDQ